MDYNFYLSGETSFENTIARLVDKICSLGKRTIVYCEDASFLSVLDDVMWTFSTNSFIPHAKDDSQYANEQIVLLTQKAENINNANILMLVNSFGLDLWHVNNFERIILIFQEKFKKNAELCFSDLKKNEQNVNYWEQTPKGWSEVV